MPRQSRRSPGTEAWLTRCRQFIARALQAPWEMADPRMIPIIVPGLVPAGSIEPRTGAKEHRTPATRPARGQQGGALSAWAHAPSIP